jgi:hypothetical protein
MTRYMFAGLAALLACAAVIMFRKIGGQTKINPDSVSQSVLHRIRAEHPSDPGL